MTRPPARPRPGARVALFPEASYGAALNCVGIAQSLRARGADPVFVCHAGFTGLFAQYGFREIPLPGGRAGAETQTAYWQGFIERHRPHFDLDPVDQIETYVAPTWDAIVDTVVEAEAGLRHVLARLRPDVVVLDNVAMFPAIADAGCPWVRVISCAETELPDPAIPPHLSGLPTGDDAGWAPFAARYDAALAPIRARLDGFRARCGLAPPAGGGFLEPSPHLNLLLSPAIVRRERRRPLDPDRFVMLEGCIRSEGRYDLPHFPRGDDPLVYVSFGSLGAMDTRLLDRLIALFARVRARVLVNVGGFRDRHSAVPDNVFLDSWYPQPSVMAMVDAAIHHGGNNTVCEALRFGVPSLVIPYCWDGHDNARRAEETGTGLRLARGRFDDATLAAAVDDLLEDTGRRRRLKENAATMTAARGVDLAAERILALVAP